MPKNKGKGGKSKRKGKNKNDEGDKRELLMKEDGQEYAQVVKMLGNCRFEAFCFDGQTRIGHVRGKFRKKVNNFSFFSFPFSFLSPFSFSSLFSNIHLQKPSKTKTQLKKTKRFGLTEMILFLLVSVTSKTINVMLSIVIPLMKLVV